MNKKYRIYAYSPMLAQWGDTRDCYAPTQFPLFDKSNEAAEYARKHMKLEENLKGNRAFEVRVA
jgi:hypothetical protein